MVRPALQRPAAALKRLVNGGFTLIEMLVVIGIIVVISGIILANNARFGGAVQLENLAYDIALSIRQAQVYGISVQRFGNTNTFAPGYGMHFDTTSPNTYVMFGDVFGGQAGDSPSNGAYDPSCACELVQSTTVQNGYAIVALYFTDVSGVESSVSALNITFRRPEPDAYIAKDTDKLRFNTSGKYISGTIGQQARIQLQSPHGEKRDIVIYANGQISVQATQPGQY